MDRHAEEYRKWRKSSLDPQGPKKCPSLEGLSLSHKPHHSEPSSLTVPTIPLTITEPTPVATSPPANPFGARWSDAPRQTLTASPRMSPRDTDLLSIDDRSGIFDVESDMSDAESFFGGSSSDRRPGLSSAPASAEQVPRTRGLSDLRRRFRKRSSGNLKTIGTNLVGAGLLGAAAARPEMKLDEVVLVQIRNETGCEVKPARWPTKMKKMGKTTYELSHFRGNYFDESLIPTPTQVIRDRAFAAGAICKPSTFSMHSNRKPRIGWLYFDLYQPSGYILHLQIFLTLGPSGEVTESMLGRFDLDSSRAAPMPSGTLGFGYTDPEIPNVITFVLSSVLKTEKNIVDDSTRKPLAIVPTKGLIVSSYVSHPDATVSLLAGKEGRYHEAQERRRQTRPTEMEESVDGRKERAGDRTEEEEERLSMIRQTKHLLGGLDKASASLWVQCQGEMLFKRSVYVHPLTGIVKDADKRLPLASTSETTSFFSPAHDLTVSFGFHDSGLGRRHFMYVYATKDNSSWLGDLIKENKRWLDMPFSRLCLAASHDAGMYTPLHPKLSELLLKNKVEAAFGQAALDIGLPVVRGLLKVLSGLNIKHELAICNIANTQKDTIGDQLRLGCRAFDFRPGFCWHDVLDGTKGPMHHQHAIVPGVEYVDALKMALLFLATHGKEIVFFELKSDGFAVSSQTWREDSVPIYSMLPHRQELARAIEDARAALASEPAAVAVQVGGASDLDRSIGELIAENRRLLIVDRMGGDVAPEVGWEWDRDDSYDHEVYDTDEPADIVAQLEKTHARSSALASLESTSAPSSSKPRRGCIYQLQATPTKIASPIHRRGIDAHDFIGISDDIAASLTYSKASSLLVGTKARVDPHTYSWIRKTRFEELGLVLLLNDFVDSVLTEHAIEKSRERTGIFSQ